MFTKQLTQLGQNAQSTLNLPPFFNACALNRNEITSNYVKVVCIYIRQGEVLVSNAFFQRISIHLSALMEDIFLTHFPLQCSVKSSIINLAFETPLTLEICRNPAWSGYGCFLLPQNLFCSNQV